MEPRRKFDDEFKREAIRLVKAGGKKVSAIAKDLGIKPSTLHGWIHKSVETKGGEIITDSEITRLRRELADAKMERDILKKSSGHLLSTIEMKYAFIKANRDIFSIVKMCRILGVAKSGYYKQFIKPRSQRDQDNDMLLSRIKDIYDDNKGNYGSPRIKKQLDKDKIPCGKNRVARLMNKNNIKAKTRRKFKVTTDSRHNHPVADNLLKRKFNATDINQKWVSDITYINTQEGWLYLAVILDLCSRKVVGWSMGDRITKELTIKALRQAMSRRGIRAGLLLHSDRGSQYACHDYVYLVKANNFIQSMSGKGNCYDNAVMESFFKTLKMELVYWEKYLTRDEARKSIFEYIECYYNSKRMHSSLDYMSPQEFENAKNLSPIPVY